MRYKNYSLPLAIFALIIVLVPLRSFAAQANRIGVGPVGTQVVQFIGRSEQAGKDLKHFGYLTHIEGLNTDRLFSNPQNRSEGSAQFTFYATTDLSAASRHELNDVITVSAPGALTIYYNPDGGNFADPASFSRGTPIATYTLGFHNVLNVQAPNEGIDTVNADLEQNSSKRFTLGGRAYRLGLNGLREHAWSTGKATRTQVEPVQAFYILGGNIVVTGR